MFATSEQWLQNISNLKKSDLPIQSNQLVSDSHKERKRPFKDKLHLSSITVGYANVPDPAKGRKLNYDELEDRMKTFKLPPQWEGPLDYQSMADCGFVYTGQEDLVFCFHCNIKLDRWSKDMEPLLRHKEESPTCSFMRQRLQAVKGERGKTKSVVAPSKPLNSRLTSSIGQLQFSSLVTSKSIHTVVTGLNEPRLSYGGSFDDHPGASLPITPENYQCEAERIKSFVGWPLNGAVHPEQLARVGFVYTGEGALVQCFQCGIKYCHWYKGDVPLNIHQKCNPRCAFLQSLGSKSKSSPPEQRPSRSYIQQSLGSNTEGEMVSKHSLQFPDYSDQAIRLQSFKHWGGVLPAHELAEGGFYMIARRDVVKCFSCKVVVQDWERSDNVIDEHQRLSPNCSSLKKSLSCRRNSESSSSSLSVDKTCISTPLHNNRSLQFPKQSKGLNSDLKLPPPRVKSTNLSKSSDDDDNKETFSAIHCCSVRQSQMNPQAASSKIVVSEESYPATAVPVQSSDRKSDGPIVFRSSSQFGSLTMPSQETYSCECGHPAVGNDSPPIDDQPIDIQLIQPGGSHRTMSLVPGMYSVYLPGQDQLSLTGQVSSNCQLEDPLHVPASEQHTATNVQPKKPEKPENEATIPQLLTSPDIKLPPHNLVSKGSSKSPDDDQEEEIPGIRYPPSWRQHRSMSPQGAPSKISEGSDESFHSVESHHIADYTMMTSLDPPKTKIMYEESLSEGLENNISIKTGDTKGDDMGAPEMGTCQICYDKKIDCIFLPCGHARTCEDCATRIKNSGQPCPYCGKGVSTTYRIYL